MSLTIKDLSFSYNRSSSLEKRALDNVSLSIDKGDFVLITGKVGSGKSTLIRHMNGLLKPQSGLVEVDGSSSADKRIKQKIGMLFQFSQKQLFGKTVQEDISFAPSNFGISGDDLKNRVRDSMDLVGLSTDLMNVSPFGLSGGQMRLVAMAGVLASKPDYLVLDEPTSGLDHQNQLLLFSTLKNLHSIGISIIVVSHQVSDFLQLVNKVILMDDGKIVFNGSSDEYLRSVSSPLPDITLLLKELHSRGFELKDDIFDVEDAFSEIYNYWNKHVGHRK
jgi:energy-coupling factor transport system ATP-binding protein